MSKFNLSDYDCIGFDLDLTLARYKLKPFNELVYKTLCNYLVTEKHYSSEYLFKPFDSNFCIRGLIADDENGNLIRISSDGTILQATHGTKWLSQEEILEYYPERHWKYTDLLVKNPAQSSEKIITEIGDFLTLSKILAFARIVDSIDNHKGPQKYYKIVEDLTLGTRSVLLGRKLAENNLGVFPELKQNPNKYYEKCSDKMLYWMKELKQKGKKLFLTTRADVGFAYLTAENTLGKNWMDLFDNIVCMSDKPNFFIKERDFVILNGFEQMEPTVDLKQGGIYAYGNWKGLKKFLSNLSNKTDPKILFIGDNVSHDVYAPNIYSQMDTISICEELEAEKVFDFEDHPEQEFIRSTLWGSFFYFKDTKKEVFLYYLMKNYAKLSVPSVEYLAKFPVDHIFSSINF